MSTLRISTQLRRKVRAIAGGRCEYCQSLETLMGVTFEVDHIVPTSAGGKTVLGNLCLSCPTCNRHKGARETALDPVTQQQVPLFHPREQAWMGHFVWSDDGTRVIGLTASGRATVEALRMNRAAMIELRQYWVAMGKHPPK